jgi:hypothetical protein
LFGARGSRNRRVEVVEDEIAFAGHDARFTGKASPGRLPEDLVLDQPPELPEIGGFEGKIEIGTVLLSLLDPVALNEPRGGSDALEHRSDLRQVQLGRTKRLELDADLRHYFFFASSRNPPKTA